MSIGFINIPLFGIIFILVVVLIQDVRKREIRHRYLLCLVSLILVMWLENPNFYIVPYSFAILVVGFVLHVFDILGAGDSKLLCVISFGVDPELFFLFIYMTVFMGGLFALAYLIYGYFTNLKLARHRGVPYAVPISISGGAMILLSHIS